MKVTKIEDLHCDAGWRINSFLKITTDEGLVGWSEYMEGYWAHGLTQVIHKLAERFVIGRDPRPVEQITAALHATTRLAPGGINQHAIGAIENALVDIKAKALGVPVFELLGGPMRDRLPLYWSHCGTYRVAKPANIQAWTGADPVRSLEDLVKVGESVARRGFRGLKTNIMRFDGAAPYVHASGTNRGPGHPECNVDKSVIKAIVGQFEALRKGAGPNVDLYLDANFNFKTDGYLRIAHALEDMDLTWMELDLLDPEALAHIRRSTRVPIASGEVLCGRRQYRSFFEKQCFDTVIIDVAWNGILEAMKIASMADAYEVNIAPHNFNSHLCTLMSAHMCAIVPNFKVMEVDAEDVLWKDEMVTTCPIVENGEMRLPTGIGWGADVNEAYVRAHSPRR